MSNETVTVSLVESDRPHYTFDQVKEYLHKPGVVVWQPAKELLKGLHDACVDGRTKEPVLANPGGDMAILMQAVISIGNEMGREFTEAEIMKIFNWYLGKFGSFYMHSDEHGMEHLMEALNQDDKFGTNFQDVEHVVGYVKNPDPNLQVRLLAYLRDPDSMGCGHLRLMMTDPGAYGASRKVLARLMAAFYDNMWNGNEAQKSKLEFPILNGSHREGAVVVVSVQGPITDETMLPLVKPSDENMSVFIYHPQATTFMQGRVALALAESEIFPGITQEHVEGLSLRMQQQLGKEVQTTVSRLGWGLPVHYVNLSQS